MSVELSPALLLVSACRDIIEEYKSKNPQSASGIERELKDVDDDYRAYLSGKGKWIWEGYLSQLCRRARKIRDYTPLSKREVSSINRGIDEAKATLEQLSGERDNSKIELLYQRHARYRLITGVAFLLIGFVVFGTTYFGLPWIAGRLLREQLNVTAGSVVESLESETAQLDSLPNALGRLTNAYVKAEKAFNAITPFNESFVQTETLLKEVQRFQETIDRSVIEVTKEGGVSSQLSSLQAYLTETPPKVEGGPEPKSIQLQLQDIAARTDGTVITLTDRLEALVGDLRAAASSLPNGAGKSSLLATINTWERDFQSLRKSALATSLVISPEDATRIDEISVGVNHLIGEVSNLTTALGNYNSAAGILVSDLKATSNNVLPEGAKAVADLVSLQQQFTGIETLADLETARTTLVNAANAMQQVVSGMESVATRGASPGIILLFGTAALFVTFGLSSLLRWVKGYEQRHANAVWATQTQFMCQVVKSLLTQGIDPSRALVRIRPVSQRDEAESQGMMPLASAIEEIVKLIRLDRR